VTTSGGIGAPHWELVDPFSFAEIPKSQTMGMNQVVVSSRI
jgi:hypothetical protein